VFANDNRFYAGSMSAHASQKVRRFIDLCQQFKLPIVTLQDEPVSADHPLALSASLPPTPAQFSLAPSRLTACFSHRVSIYLTWR
jgi:hypothetical protein